MKNQQVQQFREELDIILNVLQELKRQVQYHYPMQNERIESTQVIPLHSMVNGCIALVPPDLFVFHADCDHKLR